MATSFNLLLRRRGGQDPWPKTIDSSAKSVPTIYKIDTDRVSLYSTYIPGEAITAFIGKLDVKK